ncbi:hypothetical protein M513_09773, partial [Trichuris suis]
MKTKIPVPEKGKPGNLAEDNPPNENEERDQDNNQNKGRKPAADVQEGMRERDEMMRNSSIKSTDEEPRNEMK